VIFKNPSRLPSPPFRHWLFAVLAFFALAPVAWSLNGADIAILDDTHLEDGGAWFEGLQGIRAMLDSYGYTYENLTPAAINASKNLYRRYKLLIVGGGWAGAYNKEIHPEGFANIRKFVTSGGGFFGICAGAYFASNIVEWKPNYYSETEVYDYPLNLFKGTGRGALVDIMGWNQPTGCYVGIKYGAAMTQVKINRNLLPDSPQYMSILYYGGPLFVPSGSQASKVKTVARYQVPGKPDHGKPAMILFPYGKGKVFLSGPHPEISMNFASCNFYYDPKTWKLMNSILALLHPEFQAEEDAF
jgi:glutamine amidotransferase-like uncharacterized protein